ncbi:hypothetical protein FHW36_11095 [Chitinophaga polysaccharea]|uniref:Uncharacterized protein n=1 Tax=Chitinophaga polysaccharea TaxID=1293035 RepID=A0A561PA32_9BACT|nr:hypothetical protein [Chitinophaga polysaccharea]TWF34896.1 hypothetical protein FHW36_11095 [Chitinophaga polysaccharea]
MMIDPVTVSRFSWMLLLLFVLSIPSTFAQINFTGTTNNATLGQTSWVKAGTLTLQQGGADAVITIYGGNGFNAGLDQMGYTELVIRTSNGSSLVNGFAFSAYATRTGRSIAGVTAIRILPNAAGTAATAYDVYFSNGSYIGMGVYHVLSAYGSWAHSMTAAADPGTTAYEVPFESRTLNDTYLANSLFVSNATGNVGIGTFTPKAKLAVYGDILATKIKVSQTGWPDYVFGKDYHLPRIAELEQYVLTHQHLPEIPSAKEVADNGLDLGDINKKLLQKIEELSLYIIQLDKKNKSLEERLEKVEQTTNKH